MSNQPITKPEWFCHPTFQFGRLQPYISAVGECGEAEVPNARSKPLLRRRTLSPTQEPVAKLPSALTAIASVTAKIETVSRRSAHLWALRPGDKWRVK